MNPSDARYVDGQYFTDVVPGTRSPASLSMTFIRNRFQGRRFTHFLEIDVSDLEVIQGRKGVFVVPNDKSLDLKGRVIRAGKAENK